MADSVTAARQEVADARSAAESELDELGNAARAAVDIPTKVKRDPVRYGALAAGAAFLALNGPKRVLRSTERLLFPRRHEKRLTPKEIDQTIDRLPEEDRDAVRAHLERDFAKYLQREHATHEPNARRSLWATYDTVLAAVGALAAREMAKRLFERPSWRAQRSSLGAKPTPPPDEEGYTQ